MVLEECVYISDEERALRVTNHNYSSYKYTKNIKSYWIISSYWMN